MSNLNVWNMALSKERELDHGWRRLEQGRHLEEAIARTRPPEHSGRGLWRRVWPAIAGRPRQLRGQVVALARGEDRGQADHVVRTAPENALGAPSS